MATNIGPRIGIEGEAEYRKQLKLIVSETKNLTNQFKSLNTEFTKNNTSIQSNNKQREALNNAIKSTEKALKNQTNELKLAQNELNKVGVLNVEDATKLQNFEANVNNTANELAKLKGQLDDLPTTLEVVKQAIENNNSAWKRNGEIIKDVGSKMTKYLTLPIVAGIGATVKAAADWESGFTGVKKTVDEIYDSNGNLVFSYEELNTQLKDVASNTVVATDELLSVAEISGQLGISADKVAEFSNIMLMLGASTTLSSEEAATNIAKILNITNKGMPYSIDQVQRFGNVLVELGNNFATTEGDITLMATRLASAGSVAGLSTDEILALATAMSSVGIRAEAGGSSMAQVLVNLEKRVANFRATGGSDLDKVAQIAGMSAQQFADAWQNQPIIAIQEFIKGIGQLDENAESTSLVLEELEMDGIRQSNMIKALSQAYPLLSDAIKLANDEWQNGSAMYDEYAKRTQTFDSQVQLMKNNLQQLAIEFGETLLPTLNEFVQGLTDVIKSMRDMDPDTKKMIVNVGLLIAAIGPVLSTLGNLMVVGSGVKAMLGALSGAGGFLGLVASITPTVLLITGLGIALTALVSYILTHAEEIKTYLSECWNAIVEDTKVKFEAIGQFLQNLWDGFVNVLVSIKDFLIESWNAIVEDTTAKFNAIWEFLTQTWENIKNTFNTAIEIIVLGIAAFVFAVVGWFNDMKLKVLNLVENIKTQAISIFNKLRDGIESVIGKVYTTITEGIQKAVDWITNLIGQAWSWGADLIGGFVEGIKSKIGAVVDAVKGIADTVFGWLHFTRPDVGPLRNYEQWMPHFMQGLAKGIDANAWRVEDALSNLTGNMIIEPISKSSGSNTAYNYGGIVINLNVPEGANGQMLVDEIEQEIVNRTIRRRAVFGQ